MVIFSNEMYHIHRWQRSIVCLCIATSGINNRAPTPPILLSLPNPAQVVSRPLNRTRVCDIFLLKKKIFTFKSQILMSIYTNSTELSKNYSYNMYIHFWKSNSNVNELQVLGFHWMGSKSSMDEPASQQNGWKSIAHIQYQ